jgi:hypothetical protein
MCVVSLLISFSCSTCTPVHTDLVVTQQESQAHLRAFQFQFPVVPLASVCTCVPPVQQRHTDADIYDTYIN